MNNQGHLNDGDFIVDVCQNVFDNLLKKKNFSFLLVVLEKQKTNLSQVD